MRGVIILSTIITANKLSTATSDQSCKMQLIYLFAYEKLTTTLALNKCYEENKIYIEKNVLIKPTKKNLTKMTFEWE